MKLNATTKKYITGGALALLLGCGVGVLNVSANSNSPIRMEVSEDTVSSGTESKNRPSKEEADFEFDKESDKEFSGMKGEGNKGNKGFNVSRILEKLDDETKAKVLPILGVSEEELTSMDKDGLKDILSDLSEDQISQIKELAASVFENVKENMGDRPSRDEAGSETDKEFGGKGMNVSRILEKLDDETKAKVLSILGVGEEELTSMDKDGLKEILSDLSEDQISQIKELAASVFENMKENMGDRPSRGNREDGADFDREMTRPSKGSREDMTDSEGEFTRPSRGENAEKSFSGENA